MTHSRCVTFESLPISNCPGLIFQFCSATLWTESLGTTLRRLSFLPRPRRFIVFTYLFSQTSTNAMETYHVGILAPGGHLHSTWLPSKHQWYRHKSNLSATNTRPSSQAVNIELGWIFWENAKLTTRVSYLWPVFLLRYWLANLMGLLWWRLVGAVGARICARRSFSQWVLSRS